MNEEYEEALKSYTLAIGLEESEWAGCLLFHHSFWNCGKTLWHIVGDHGCDTTHPDEPYGKRVSREFGSKPPITVLGPCPCPVGLLSWLKQLPATRSNTSI